jgi:hypothetical protein
MMSNNSDMVFNLGKQFSDFFPNLDNPIYVPNRFLFTIVSTQPSSIYCGKGILCSICILFNSIKNVTYPFSGCNVAKRFSNN